MAYHGDELAGVREWQGEFTDIPLMGADGREDTRNYILSGKAPQFKIYRQDELIDLEGDIPKWENNGLFILTNLQKAAEIPESFA